MQSTLPASINPLSSAENELGYGQLFAVILRRKIWVFASVIAGLAIGYVHTSQQDPTFVSGMQLLVESNYQGKRQSLNLGDEITDGTVSIDPATQIALLKSSDLLKRALDKLEGIDVEFDPNNPRSVMFFQKSLAISQVQGGDKKQAAATKIFEMVYTSDDPRKTQAVLQALRDVYREYNREQQQLRLQRGLEFLEGKLPNVREEVKDAERKLEEFRRKTGIIDPQAEAQIQVSQVKELEQAIQTNATQLRELAARYQGLEQQISMSPQQALVASRISQSGRYQAVLAELQKTELLLAQQGSRFTDETAQIRQIEDQRQRQLQLLQLELTRILGGGLAGVGFEQLQSLGQMSSTDINLVNTWVETRLNLEAIQAKQESLIAMYTQMQVEMQKFPKLLAEYGRLQPDIATNRDTLQQLLKAQQDIALELARGGFDWQIVEQPQLGYQTGPDLKKNLLLGAVAGLFIGGMAAFAREAMDDALHTSEDLQKQIPVPLLGVVPTFRGGQQMDDEPLFSLPFQRRQALPSSMSQVLDWRGFREALDLLYQNIQLLQAGTPLKSLVVTSALAGEGKSTVALGLAMSAARLHQRVLLVDADLRRPSLHQLMSLPNERGLSNFLMERGIVPQEMLFFEEGDRTGISVLTAGATPPDPARLLSSHRLRDILATFESHYDLVIVDAPPVLGAVDTLLTAACCQGTLLVGRINRVKKAELTQALTSLAALNVVGVVANDGVVNTSGY